MHYSLSHLNTKSLDIGWYAEPLIGLDLIGLGLIGLDLIHLEPINSQAIAQISK